MQVLKGRVTIILLLLLSAAGNAQFYEYGQDAGLLKWSQFETPHYHVIYPRGIDSLAGQFARRIESYYPYLGAALDHQHSRMPVIIHNESSFSNGVFVWAPKRLEIFTNPDPNGYNQDWLTQLALHEGRHAVQIDKLNQGFTRGLYYIGGEQLVGAMAVFLPYWYLEGDAVDAETRLSLSGRGRQPSFEMELKAQVLGEKRLYSFSKATMGSFRHHIPDHYQLGYLMVRYGRRTYGEQFWIDFQQYAARKPYLFNPTYFAMKRYGLSSKKQFYLDALGNYRQHWARMDSLRYLTPYDDWNNKEIKHFTNYRFPRIISESLVFALKEGKDQIPEFILLGRNGEERSLFRPGYLSSGRVSFSGTHIVWDEFVPDTRWSNRNYSVVRSYEFSTGKVSKLGRRTRYFSPAVSHDGSKVAVIEQTAKQQFYLVIMSLSGSVLHRIPSDGNSLIQHPAWMEGDSAVLVVESDGQGKSLVTMDPGEGLWNTLFQSGLDDISYPAVSGKRIYFNGTFSGIDNIYCHDVLTNETYQVTSVRFGAFYPQLSADGQTLIYSNYTPNGFRIAEMPMEEGLWKPLVEAMDHGEQLDHSPSREESLVIENTALQDTVTYPVKKYHKVLHLFKFHSWLPFYFDYLNPELDLDPGQLPVSLGASLVSQNHLSTAVSQLGYEFSEGFHQFHSGIKFKGRYPVVNLFFDYGGEPEVLLFKEEADTAMALPRDLGLTLQLYVPFRFNTGKYLSIIQPRVDYQYRQDLQYIEEEDLYRSGAHYLYYRLYASLYLRMGERDILPRLGLTPTLGYYHAPFDHRVFGAVSTFGLVGYIPGILKHQTIRLNLQWQAQYPLDPTRPAFINLVSMPRGLYGIYAEKMLLSGVDYVFPIVYPDLEILSLVYLKRIRGACWIDHMAGTNVIISDPTPHYEDKNYTTIGIDLLADVNLFRIPFPVSFGVRFLLEPATEIYRFEGLYTIDIN